MQTIGSLFQQQLEKIVESEIERLKDNLSTSVSAGIDFIRIEQGKISALRWLMSEAMSSAQESAEQRNR
jgi:hypothetical protein